MRAVYGIVAREFVRFWRQRGRVLASIGRPFVWLVFAGGGFAAVFAGRSEIDYRVYMAPGLLGMVVMFGSLLAALSTVTDREAGVLRMVLVAPIRRSTVAFGKTLGATLLGTAQAIVVAAILLPFVQLRPTLAGALLGLVALVLSGLALGALGVVLAASIRSIENFAGVMNFVVFPMLFLSGALYPVRHLGPVLRAVAYVNPLAYGVDLLKHALLSRWAGAGYGGELPAPLDCAALAPSIRSIENFAGVMNFVVFPMLFLSGALYPVRHLGPVLRAVAYVNPLAYGVDLLKHALLSRWAGAGYGGELPAPLDCAALALFAIVGLAVAAPLLGREGGVTRAAFRDRR